MPRRPHALSLKQSLIWHEAVSIALLGPIAQHNTADLHNMNIQLGTGFYARDGWCVSINFSFDDRQRQLLTWFLNVEKI